MEAGIMDPWTRIDPKTRDVAPPAADPETGRLPPSSVAVFLAAGVMLACFAYGGVALWVNLFQGVVILAPVLVGALVGAFTRRRPLRSFAWLLVVLCVACGLWALALGGYAIYALFYLPLPMPGLFIGVICGHTLRRHVRGRTFERLTRSL
jgi:hypothetical protein